MDKISFPSTRAPCGTRTFLRLKPGPRWQLVPLPPWPSQLLIPLCSPHTDALTRPPDLYMMTFPLAGRAPGTQTQFQPLRGPWYPSRPLGLDRVPRFRLLTSFATNASLDAYT
ncbi:hypothetical protein FA95DRAFT_1370966 [Auriscalpium vulgare]|uniref:Uncharacterized protein n=1 Tax=Auriscalpium vulgare TaxID=40419 RepID=A0ACB8RRS6_9AGAM|nr:hypothetical protein FA95DRAFT_1370966 [Auriscalpium vulgare]